MSQRSILSFFKTSNQTGQKEAEKRLVAIGNTTSKNVKNKRKVLCIESDEESSDAPMKNSSNKYSKLSEDPKEEIVKLTDLSSTKDVEENSPFSSITSPKQSNFENGKEINSFHSPDKVQSDASKDISENIKIKEIDNNSSKKEETSNSSQNEVIPKRKTARKQLGASKGKISQLQKELKLKSETNGSVNPENENNDSELKVETNLLIPDNSDCNSEDKEPCRNIVSSDSKLKTETLSKDGNSPKIYSVKKESFHSFFSPFRKVNDKSSSGENNESEKSVEVNDDSPIKGQKRRKKNILESDDEESISEELALKNVAQVSNVKDDCSLLEDNKDVKSEKNKTSPKKVNQNMKISNESKKLGLKSASDVGAVYNPSKCNYQPFEDACWKLNEKVPYLALAKTLELIENTSGRLKTIEILSNFFRSVIVLTPDDLLHSIYLCLNRVAPEYEGIEMGVGETLLMKALAQATGRTLDKIKAEVAIKGDLGLVSESSRGNQRVMFAPPKLTVSSVFNKFLEIAKMSGNASMAKKTDKIKSLFVACQDCEAKYIIRSLSGKLRIGLAEQSILSAIARAVVITPPGQNYPPEKIDASKGMSPESFKKFLDSQTLILKTAYCECPNYDLVIPVLLKNGISALPDHCQLSPGIPLKPMLAHPTAGIEKVLERFDKNAFTCEFKYDGERAQIHMDDKGKVKIFSRNQEDNTSKYPDVVSRISSALKKSTKSFVLDSEAVAWDREIKQILPFQVLSTRKRKDAVESEIVVQVCIMAFDLLYLNGESLVKKPLKERRNLLHSSFNDVENQFMFAQYKDGNSAETMQEFLEESTKSGCEGLMVKSLEIDASYEIAKRSHNWLKLKKDYLQGIGDTLDLVVIGGYYGMGKRAGSYGGFLLACYDEDNEEFQSICKLGTGFKEDALEAHTAFLKQHVIEEPKSYFRYDQSLVPDEWFEPVQVWEIKCADLSISPVHKAAVGIVDPEKGISLRFPRFVRIREDKSPENATNSTQIADMYQNQQQIQNTANKNAKVEEDFY